MWNRQKGQDRIWGSSFERGEVRGKLRLLHFTPSPSLNAVITRCLVLVPMGQQLWSQKPPWNAVLFTQKTWRSLAAAWKGCSQKSHRIRKSKDAAFLAQTNETKLSSHSWLWILQTLQLQVSTFHLIWHWYPEGNLNLYVWAGAV